MQGSTSVVAPARASRGALYAFLGTTAFLAIAILKPWGSARPTPAPPGNAAEQVAAGVAHAPPSPTETAGPPSAGPGQIVCAPAGWQIVTLDRMADWTVRTWIPAAPVAASGPLDPIIPTLRLESPEVLSIGVCGSSGPSPSDATAVAMSVVAAWSTDTGVAAPGSLRVLELATAQGTDLDARLARLYAPIGGGTIPAAWPMGRFVLELAPLPAATVAPDAGGSLLRWYVAIAVPAVADQAR